MKTVRIGLDAREFEGGAHTGIQTYLRAFLEGAVKERPGWEFHLFGTQDTEFPLSGPNVLHHRIREGVRVWWDQILLPRALSRGGIDVFLTPYVKVPILARMPVIVWMNDLSPILLDRWGTFAERLYFRILCVCALLKAADVITISDATAADVRRVFGIGRRKIRTVHIGVREDLFEDTGADAEVRRSYGLEQDYILHVSNLRAHKNVSLLVEAYVRLDSTLRERFPLVLVGRTENLDPGIRSRIEADPLKRQVQLLGEIPDAHLGAVYRGAAVFVFPSLYEGFGLPVLEAMHCGVPVVVSNVSSLPELVGDAGMAVPPGDVAALEGTLARLLSRDVDRLRWAARARERAAVFNSVSMVERIISTIEGSL